MKNVFLKSFTREFPLVHVQMWGRRYEKEFLSEPLPQIPKYIFSLKNGLVTAYRNVEGQTSSVHEIIKGKISKDKDYLDRIVLQYKDIVKAMSDLRDKDDITNAELVVFLDYLFDAWQPHYVAQFVPLDEKRFSKFNRDKAFNLRQTIDADIVSCWDALKPMLKRIYPALGDLVMYISWDEIKSAQIPLATELAKREAEGVLLLDGEIISRAVLEKLIIKHEIEMREDISDSLLDKIKGQTACPGLATGTVRVILKKDDVKNFVPGEILVSYMTMPVFISAMKKAAAFVTDEGGITCHAAIISRELNKPCVIGTRVATQVLKDGDLVEVDANKGVVNILKRS